VFVADRAISLTRDHGDAKKTRAMRIGHAIGNLMSFRKIDRVGLGTRRERAYQTLIFFSLDAQDTFLPL
jgi:hypothetical protein